MPKPSIIALRPPATNTPATRPTTEATSPTKTASSSWARQHLAAGGADRPQQRHLRRRWVTMIWNVL